MKMQVRNPPQLRKTSFFYELFELNIWLKKDKVFLLILFSLNDFKTDYTITTVLQVNRDNIDNKCMLLYET